MKQLNFLPLIVVVVTGMLLMTACKKQKTLDDITNVKWQLVKFVDVANDTYETPIIPSESDKTHYWIQFNKDNTIKGFGYINTFEGFYEMLNDTIHIISFGRTKINDENSLEEKMCDIMNESSLIKQINEKLIVYHSNNQNYLEFIKID